MEEQKGWLALIWDFLNTPPPKPEIPIFTQAVEGVEGALSQWIAGQVLGVTQWLSTLLLYTPSAFLQSEAFKEIHGFVAALAYAGMVPVLAWAGIRTVVGKQTAEEAVRQVARFAVVPVGIHLTPPAVLMFLNLFNNLAGMILQAAPLNPEQALTPPVFDVTLLIFLALYVWLAVQLVKFYCYRNYAIAVLVALSPLMLLAWAVDEGHKFQRWQGEVMALLTTQVAHALQLVILVAMTVGAGSVAEEGVPIIAIQVGALMFMTRTPEWLKEYMHTVPEGLSMQGLRRNTLTVNRLLRRVKGVLKS